MLQGISLNQANGFGVTVYFDPFPISNQKGIIAGNAHYLSGDDLHQTNGQVHDVIFDGVNLKFFIIWPGKVKALYEGSFKYGRLSGKTEDTSQSTYNSTAWKSPQKYTCALQQEQPKAQVGAISLVGVWDIQTSNGGNFTLTLSVNGSAITGYLGAVNPEWDGTLEGKINVESGRGFYYTMIQPKINAEGKGGMRITADGNEINGIYVASTDPNTEIKITGRKRQ
ncbi:MAG: hypothetical protein WCE69_11180 [Aestuariivirga sp.]